MKRTAFFISDGTGITAETLGQSLLAQFENITFHKLTRPYIDSVEKARAMVQQINAAAERDGVRPIIFDTIVNQDIRDILAQSDGFMVDIFSCLPVAAGAGTHGAARPTRWASRTPLATPPTTWSASTPCTSPSTTTTARAPTTTTRPT